MSKSESIARQFESLFGQAPEVIAAAPGRVNLIGEHIDYSNGFVLPFAISANTYCAIRTRSDQRIRISSIQQGAEILETSLAELTPLSGPEWSRYLLGVIWALNISDGIDVLVDSEVPVGAGLSSSAALECSLATALNHQFKLNLTSTELARRTQRAENDFVGVPCGIMDQSISLMGKSGRALLLDCRDLSTREVRVDFASAGLQLLIVDTRAHHALIDGGYAERRSQCEIVAQELGVASMRDLSLDQLNQAASELNPIAYRRAHHAVTEISRVLEAVAALEANDFTHFGELLTASHRSLRDDYNVSCPELDLAVEVSLREGALGARMVGGGFGGSAIALIREEDSGRICQSLEREFAIAGFGSPRFFDSLPSDGARILS
jgi:galactokinase